ncbi:hypothetical protein FP2506_06516 [Fulvimarina pelagi HTCC2506]|uniref:Uncharacterized protein n=1 Tax=Fulvimarina pelagi HTCC2506 TaxID=314231 RepID=Q0G793_9HYPH|nr:DUF2735 domain-containing protein [Fulvimarina pelagi]EAU42471.1 hypothetical protein FP2506_06516 [Fulvimarina pelagi HTCC2506]
MATGFETQSATIYQFPVGGRSGMKNQQPRAWPSEKQVPQTVSQFDWRAAYHAEAIAEETGRN